MRPRAKPFGARPGCDVLWAFHIFLVAVTALFTFSAICRAADPAAVFDQANSLYAQGKFPEAAEEYKALLSSGYSSPAVLFNLGNAYFKAGQLGRAIAAYRTAQARAPRDPDLQANLRFARNRVQGPTVATPAWHRLLARFTLNEWTASAALALWISLLLLAAAQWRPTVARRLRSYLLACAFLFVVLAAATWADFQAARTPLAIVSVPEATVRQAPLDDSQSSFVVHDGAELLVLDTKGDWLQVTPNGTRIGWVRRDQVLAATSS